MRSTSSGWMPLPVLPTLPRLGGEARSSLLPGLPIPARQLCAPQCFQLQVLQAHMNICLVDARM